MDGEMPDEIESVSSKAREEPMKTSIQIYQSDNLTKLKTLPDQSIALIYIDPPFNTQRTQKRTQLRTAASEDGNRTGFQGKRYTTEIVGTMSYQDRLSHDDYIEWLRRLMEEAKRTLKANGSLFVHIDFREVHYVKVMLDQVFGRDSFMNEIIWAYDYGGRSKTKWSSKHDNILWYAKNPEDYIFNYEEIDRIPYMAPGLVGAEKAAKGKTPTDCWEDSSNCGDYWWNTIVPTNGKEKTGYPTQKPLGILTRIVRVHSNPGDLLLDFFAGSGSFGHAALSLERNVILIDNNTEAIAVMKRRFAANLETA